MASQSVSRPIQSLQSKPQKRPSHLPLKFLQWKRGFWLNPGSSVSFLCSARSRQIFGFSLCCLIQLCIRLCMALNLQWGCPQQQCWWDCWQLGQLFCGVGATILVSSDYFMNRNSRNSVFCFGIWILMFLVQYSGILTERQAAGLSGLAMGAVTEEWRTLSFIPIGQGSLPCGHDSQQLMVAWSVSTPPS